jgi:mannose-6-phosphate isomerase-like protein (cupin superfamily)
MTLRLVLCGLLVSVSTALLPPSLVVSSAAETKEAKLHAKVVGLDSAGKDDLKILGPPESVSMRSGLVVLAPGKSVGKHTTGQNEELLVVLEGKGAMTFADGSKLPVEANHALYCPPATEHNVTNSGTSALRYVYVVARAR